MAKDTIIDMKALHSYSFLTHHKKCKLLRNDRIKISAAILGHEQDLSKKRALAQAAIEGLIKRSFG